MTKPQWQNHVRGINDGEDLPPDFVLGTYDKISSNEIKMESDTNMFSGAQKSGYCTKQGGKIRSWKKRYFVLDQHQLFYFKDVPKGGDVPIGIIPLENLKVREDKATKHGFRIYSEDGSIIKSVRISKSGAPRQGNHAFYLVGASSAEEQKAWIDAIMHSIHRSPFYELLAKRLK